jgi:hypothetical protein
VNAKVEFRMLALVDETPAADRSLLYRVGGGYFPLDWLQVFGRLGVTHELSAESGETGARMEDLLLGSIAQHSLSLEGLGWDRSINFMHRLGLYLPTSFESRQQDLYVAPEWLTEARLRLYDELWFGLTGIFQYRFHKYAEGRGPGAGTLPRVVLAGLAFLEYSPLASETYGTLTIGADFYGYEIVDYPSISQGSIDEAHLPENVNVNPDDLAGETASGTYSAPQYGYDFYVTYVPPWPYLALTVSWEQGGNVMRNGVPNLFFFHRDETALVFTLTGRY